MRGGSLCPTQQVGGSCVQGRSLLARTRPWGATEGGGEYGVGLVGLCLSGPLGALPLRAFFCSFSVSEDFFLISCRARLYSAGTEERYNKGLHGVVVGNPSPSPRPTFRVVLVQLVD